MADTWSRTTRFNAPEARTSHTAVWTGSVMVVWGGVHFNSYFDTGGRYDPLSDTWTPTSTGKFPGVRTGHRTVWTGNVMVVWGGNSYLNTGGRYDPLIDAWTPTSVDNAPQGRSGHTAVWTGSEMVVWGGSTGAAEFEQFFDTGGRYDPLADTWTPTTTAVAPAARTAHVAVWTGELMVVWGGYDEFGLHLDTGGRYDPVRDAWAPTTRTNAPTARRDHTAVWTGSEMVVWGGHTGEFEFEQFFDTGGRYDPLANTWTPTTTIEAPAARAAHVAVWTGKVMVAWGGEGDDSYYDTGGRYDPVADAWTPTLTRNAPQARYGHTAIWTGSVMVVWGGSPYYGGDRLNTGGRYNPLIDAWTPTTTDNAPQARSGHTAVWAGNKMIVWGGSGGVEGLLYPLDTGGRYGAWKVCATCWPLCPAVNQ